MKLATITIAVLLACDAMAQADGPEQIFVYQISTGETTQISLSSPLYSPSTIDGDNVQISGTHVVWHGWDGDDYEIFHHDLTTGITEQLTSNAGPDYRPQISGDNILWDEQNGSSLITQHYDLSTGVVTQIQIDEKRAGADLRISGDHVVWTAGASFDDWEVYAHDLSTGVTTQITDNSFVDGGNRSNGGGVEVSGSNIVWRSGYNETGEINHYNLDTGISTQITDDAVYDRFPVISGTDIAWQAQVQTESGYTSRLNHYDISTGQTTVLDEAVGVTDIFSGRVACHDNDGAIKVYDLGAETIIDIPVMTSDNLFPDLSEGHVAWIGYDYPQGDPEIYLYEFSTGATIQVTDNSFSDGYSHGVQVSGDYVVWGAAVPEPTTMSLLALGGIAMLRRRARQ